MSVMNQWRCFSSPVLSAATEAVSLKAAFWPRKVVLGWNKAFDESVKARNRAERRSRSFLVEGTVLGYQRVRVEVSRDIKSACWRACIGEEDVPHRGVGGGLPNFRQM